VASAENIASLGRLASSNSYLYCSRSNQAYLLQSSLAIAKEIPFDLCPFTYIGFNGKTIVTIGPESQIREWHIEKETGTVFSTSTDLSLVIEEEPRIVALSPGGEFYASENLGDIQVFSSKDRRKILQAHSSGRIVVAAFSPDDSFLVTGNDNGYVSILDMNGRSRKDLHVSDFQLSYISVSDEKQIAIGSRDGTIQILDRAGGVLKLLKGHTGAIQSLNYSNHFKLLISSSEDSTIRIWRLQKDTSFLELAFSQEGAYIFSGGFIESIPAALNKNIFFRRQNALSDESENGNFVRDLITKFLTEHDR